MAFILPQSLAHRGLHTHFPENTLAAFRAAQEVGATWIECDVMLSRDAMPVIFHDDRLDDLTDVKGYLCELSWQQLQQLSVHRRDQPDSARAAIPSLAAVLAYLDTTTMGFNLEIKANGLGDALTCACVLSVLQAFSGFTAWLAAGRWLISSLSRDAVRFMAEHAPQIPRAYIVRHYTPDCIAFALQHHCVSVHFWVGMDNVELLLAEARQAGLPTLGFTVNSPSEVQAWIAKGVKGVFTDNRACYDSPSSGAAVNLPGV